VRLHISAQPRRLPHNKNMSYKYKVQSVLLEEIGMEGEKSYDLHRLNAQTLKYLEDLEADRLIEEVSRNASAITYRLIFRERQQLPLSS
jgi:hypothetical protein